MEYKPDARPRSLDQLKFDRRAAVRWFSPGVLARSGIKVVLASAFGDYLDKRELQTAFAAGLTLDARDDAEMWFDFVADSGDGFAATYTVAWAVSQRELTVRTDAGPTLRAVTTRLLAQRGGLDQADLAIDLNDLNGLQKRELTEIIVASYDRADLELLLSDKLNIRLAALVGVAPFRQVVFDVIMASQAQGWTDQLVAAVQRARPHNPLVASLVSRLSLLGVEGDRNLAGRSLERTVAEQSPFQDVSLWTTTLARLSGQVCRIEGAGATATGFLVGPDLVLTTFHTAEVLMKAAAENRAGSGTPPFVCRFDHTRESEGTHQGIVVSAAPDWMVHHARYSTVDTERSAQLPAVDELDYALLRLASPVGDEAGRSGSERRGWVDVGRRTEPAKPGETVFILQHAQGEPVRVTAGRILALNGNGTRVRYDANAFGGSSGGPCIDAALNLIAMHHAGVESGPQIFNEGIPIGLIVEHLRTAHIALPAAAGPEASA